MSDNSTKYDLKVYLDKDLAEGMEYSSIKNDLKFFYNQEAFDRKEKTQKNWKLECRNKFLAIALQGKKTSLLDIGAGTGNDSLFFESSGLDVTAIDLSEEMIRVCKEKQLCAMVLDYYELFRLERKYDCIWSMNSLLHTPKKDMHYVLEQINNVLNNDGLFYLGTYGGENYEWFEKNEKYSISRFFAEYSNESLKGILSDVFELISFEEMDVGLKVNFQSVLLRKKIL